MKLFAPLSLCALGLAATLPAAATPLVPTSDAQIIEVLPAAAGDRAQEQRLRREWAARPNDERVAVALARWSIDAARAQGDPRRAGQALAALQAWPDASTAPDDVLLMRATIEQYLHDFDTAAAHLQRLVTRRPQHAQAWLTLATVRRVQGRYGDSDAACDALARAGGSLYASACLAENAGLRGEIDTARATLRRLIATPRLAPDSATWLLTTLAELEARAGRSGEAEQAYRSALAASHDGYTVLSYADFLMQQSRHADALALLKSEPNNDAVLLRRAIAGACSNAPDAPRDAREMRERMNLANLRPDARTTHAREQAMFALWVDKAPQRALQLARINVRHQREPLDLLVLAESARQAGEGTRDVQTIKKEMGLYDQRLDSML